MQNVAFNIREKVEKKEPEIKKRAAFSISFAAFRQGCFFFPFATVILQFSLLNWEERKTVEFLEDERFTASSTRFGWWS